VLVDYRMHFNETSYAQIVQGTAIWWAQGGYNPGAYGTGAPTPVNPIPTGTIGEVRDGGWAFRQDSGTPSTAPAVTAKADFISAIPVGRLVHQAAVSLRSTGKHPFTISGVHWTAVLHTRSDRG
jgi:hypothetical protein